MVIRSVCMLVYSCLCLCVALVPARGSVWARCCWGSWVLWPAGGWTGVLPGGPVDTRHRDNTAVSTTHTHTFALCLHFLKITGGIHLALHGGAHLFANLSERGPSFTGPQMGLRGRKCNSVTLPHPFFPFSHTSLDILSIVPRLKGPSYIMWQRFATLWTDDSNIRLDFWNRTRTGSLVQWQNAALKTKTLGNSKSVGKQLFEEHHQDAHLLPGPEEREEGYIVNIDLWKGCVCVGGGLMWLKSPL